MDDLYSGKKAVVGIIGLGYVGMPLALAAWTAGFRVVGFDIDPESAKLVLPQKVDSLHDQGLLLKLMLLHVLGELRHLHLVLDRGIDRRGGPKWGRPSCQHRWMRRDY